LDSNWGQGAEVTAKRGTGLGGPPDGTSRDRSKSILDNLVWRIRGRGPPGDQSNKQTKKDRSKGKGESLQKGRFPRKKTSYSSLLEGKGKKIKDISKREAGPMSVWERKGGGVNGGVKWKFNKRRSKRDARLNLYLLTRRP